MNIRLRPFNAGEGGVWADGAAQARGTLRKLSRSFLVRTGDIGGLIRPTYRDDNSARSFVSMVGSLRQPTLSALKDHRCGGHLDKTVLPMSPVYCVADAAGRTFSRDCGRSHPMPLPMPFDGIPDDRGSSFVAI